MNKLVDADCVFVFWVADWFRLMNNKLGGINKLYLLLLKDPANFGKDMRKQKSGRKIKYPELDEHIKQWFQNLRQARAPVSTFMMRNEARKFINDKNITDINLSRGWQQKIMKRLNVVKRKATHIAQKSLLLFEPEIKKFVDLITELRYYVLQSLLIS